MSNKLEKVKKVFDKYNIKDFDKMHVYELFMLYQGYRRKSVEELKREGKDEFTEEYIFRAVKTTKRLKIAILEGVKIKRKENNKFANEIINSRMFKLSCILAEKQKKLKKIYIDGNNWYYKGKLADVFDCMQAISLKAMSGKNIQEYLRAYCEGQNE